MIFREILATGENRLKKAGIFEARVECEHMLMHLLNQSRSQIYLSINDQVPTAVEKQIFEWISAREKRIPLAYLLGDVFFHSLKLKVGPGSLIPRPETERLVDVAAEAVKAMADFTLLDLGTGTGAIALALLKRFPQAKAVLVDISAEALKIARENTEANGLSSRAELILSDLFSGLELSSDGRQGRKQTFDLIISNPPYLTDEDMRQLQPEVAFEPEVALAGGIDGLDFYRRIIPQAKHFLKPGGVLGFEIGAGQANAICAVLEKNDFFDLRVLKDHQKIERIVLCRSAFA